MSDELKYSTEEGVWTHENAEEALRECYLAATGTDCSDGEGTSYLEVVKAIEKLQQDLSAAKAQLMKIYDHTCIHHNDKERQNLRCPICLAKERDEAKAEVERLKLETAYNAGKVCFICKWTNSGCLNLGNPNEEPFWVCHGCIKREHGQLTSAHNALRVAREAITYSQKLRAETVQTQDELEEEYRLETEALAAIDAVLPKS